jgi:hypothetical protein
MLDARCSWLADEHERDIRPLHRRHLEHDQQQHLVPEVLLVHDDCGRALRLRLSMRARPTGA